MGFKLQTSSNDIYRILGWEVYGGAIMSQATFSVRMDENLKKEFDALCADFGMSATTAFNIFARAVVRERKIPFEIAAKIPNISREDALKAFMTLRQQAKANGVQDMTYPEIDAEIAKERRCAEGTDKWLVMR